MIILRTVKNFSSLNVVASILLFLTAILAALVANSSLSSVYQDFLLQELHLRIGDFNLLSHGGHNLTMIEFINDCLMTIFFFSCGIRDKTRVTGRRVILFQESYSAVHCSMWRNDISGFGLFFSGNSRYS